MTVYHAHVERDGQFWLIHVPEVDRWTQARNLGEVETMARDLVAVMTGSDPASVQIDVAVTLPAAATEHLRMASELRETAARANSLNPS